MASETSICNQALSWLGADRITDLSDGSDNANLCKDNYNELRNSVIEEANWTFATRRYTLSPPLAAGPEYGYGNKFQLAPEVLRIIEASDSASFYNGVSNLDWRREEDFILADVSIIYAKCLIEIADSSKFSSLFVQSLAARIAAELSPTITESNKKTDQMWTLYSKKLAIASVRDAGQGSSDRIRARNLTRVR